MPTYEFECTECKDVFSIFMRMADLDEVKVECSSCNKPAKQIILTPISVSIPHHMQACPSFDKKEKARLPINIIDEKPEGGYKVTRIGKKSDIDND